MAGIFCINTISEVGFSVAMTVRNNAAAMYALNQLGRNDSDLTKQLKKVSSGMRINSAADDASGYAISVRLRSLEGAYGQDIQNAQTGANLVAVAEGGIQSVVDNLRTMKEMMLNARNDTNTDADRATIQKELEKRLQTITDIAAETNYNGRLLLNGDYSMYGVGAVTSASPASEGINPNKLKGLCGGFSSGDETAEAPETSSPLTGSRYCPKAYNGTKTSPTPLTYDTMKKMTVKIDFSSATKKEGGTPAYPSDFDGEGFAILCSVCGQYINIKFDASKSVPESTYDPTPKGAPSDWSREYVIGIKDVTNEISLEKALFDGIKAAKGSTDLAALYADSGDYTYIDPEYYTKSAIDYENDISVDPEHNMRLVKTGDGYAFTRFVDDTKVCFYDEGTIEPLPTPPPKYEKDIYRGNPLIIHTGPKQNQYIPIFINSMHPIALGINGARVDDDRILDKTEPLGDPSVNKFAKLLKQVDDAIDYTLNEIVRMGAYRQRLSMTEDNLTTAQENTVSAKSTIADADMAKEMTGYTKANVLAQTAQSMVAQANQNLGGVLDLLQ